MLLLVTKGLGTLLRYNPRNVGRMVQPRALGRIPDTPRAGFVWAADNDCFNGFHQGRYERMLDAVKGVPACLFVTSPDVVGDSRETLRLFGLWSGRVAETGPVGLVAQDGLTVQATPWDEIQTLFIGGTTEWKLGEEAALLVKEAKDRGKWVHMGRVNTWRRLEYAKALGVDSVDGTKLSWFSDTYLNDFAELAAAPDQMLIPMWPGANSWSDLDDDSREEYLMEWNNHAAGVARDD